MPLLCVTALPALCKRLETCQVARGAPLPAESRPMFGRRLTGLRELDLVYYKDHWAGLVETLRGMPSAA